MFLEGRGFRDFFVVVEFFPNKDNAWSIVYSALTLNPGLFK